MQEEVTQKTIALSMKTGKLTAQALQAALKKYLQHRAKGPKLHHGKQSLKQLKAHSAAVYVFAGTANVEGGTYSVQQKYPDSAKGDEFVLNCYDANRANGTARINVTGGTFKNFNPADNKAEGEGNNFADNSLVVQKNNTVQNNDYYVGNAANEVIAAASKGEEIFVLNGTTLTNVPAGVIIQNGTDGEITVNGEKIGPNEGGDSGYVVPAPTTIVIITPSEDTTPKTEDQKNPSTGANDVVAAAVALMAVSALGAAVLTRKK